MGCCWDGIGSGRSVVAGAEAGVVEAVDAVDAVAPWANWREDRSVSMGH